MAERGPESSEPAPFQGDERFRVLSFLGRGGFGSVYRVFDREIGAEIALKTIRARGAESLYRLKQEFRSLAGIVHPNLTQLYELVVRADACFFTMEYVSGLDFVQHVRRGPGGEGRDAVLRRFHESAPQLVGGLAALHAAGRLHRDVKPSNVLVEPAGRVVLLDFDLVALMDEPGTGGPPAGELAGTLCYMAPEQFWGLPPTPAADWYGAGVLFHEALTGRLPFDAPPTRASGAGAAVLANWDHTLPAELEALVSALLAPDPSQRPASEALRARLEAVQAGAPVRPVRAPAGWAGFVGREQEVRWLGRMLRDVGGTRIAGIHGVSGIGKTELVRRFLAESENRDGAVVLAGRCHPQEAVPFKALDPIMDVLSRYLISLDETSRLRLLPRDASVVARLFPVLGRVPMTERAEATGLDVTEVRRKAVGVLRELLRRMAEEHPLVLWIDDAQWSDPDSAALLGELLRPPTAPPLLLVLCYRSEARDRVELGVVRDLAREFSALTFEEVELGPLDADASLVLARQLSPPDLAEDFELEGLVSESGGSPFLLAEIMWHLRSRAMPEPGAPGSRIDLAAVLSSRIDRLDEAERRILEIVSVCGRPTERSVVLEATRFGERGRPLVQRLEGLGFLRTAPGAGDRQVETYHDRIRESVIGGLADATRVSHHRDLAFAFEASGRAEPELLAHHFHGGGILARAADYALAAADRAAEALAFVRAAELYRSAREWHPRDAAHQRGLLAREGDAMAKAAHLVEGGRLFLRAAHGAGRLENLELRRRAAEHLVSGGDLDAGLHVLEQLLVELGLRYPRTPRRALAAAVARLARVVLYGIEPRAATDSLDELERIRIDTCYGASKNLVDADSARGIYFSLVSLERALRAGEPSRIARNLCVVGGSLSVVGGAVLRRIGARMLRSAEQIARQIDSPEMWGTLEVSLGQVHMLDGRCREALELSGAGVERLAGQCQGFALECNIGRVSALRALEELGRLDELGEGAQGLLDAASAVGNRYAETQGSQYLAVARLACGDVAGARELVQHGLGTWLRHEFYMQHFYAVRIQALCDLYEAVPRQGWERLRKLEPGLRRSGLLRIPLTRIDNESLRGALALAVASLDPARRRAGIRTCSRSVRRLEREERSDATLHARLLRGGMAALRGETRRAIREFEHAICVAEESEMALRAACARLRLAELRGDPGAVRSAREEMVRCGVRDPARWVSLYAPGLPASA